MSARQDFGLSGSKLIRADIDLLAIGKMVQRNPLFLFENKRIQKELFLQLHAPLSAKGSWGNDEDTTLTFSPKLADNNTSLYCFPNPTSSARITPLEKGDWNAKRAAIT